MFKHALDDIMDRKLTRGEFLKSGGLLVLAIIGIPSIIKALNHNLPDHSSKDGGNRPYGS